MAPTPSGYLHTGNLYNFLISWIWARINGGSVLLRIDDLDSERMRPEYLSDIFRKLEWLGLDWDIGPTGPDDFQKNWSQRHRAYLYIQILEELREKGLVFACDCSRKKLDGFEVYPGNCLHKNLSLDGRECSWRIRLETPLILGFEDLELGWVQQDLRETSGSFVVRRRDAIPAYQIASLADDLHFQITHIARGKDLLNSTFMQLYLAEHLYIQTFAKCIFWHHELIHDKGGKKISKSAGHGNEDLGHIPVTGFLASFSEWMGLKEKAFTLPALLRECEKDSRFRF